MPYEEYDRLKAEGALPARPRPISDIAMIFLNDIDVMLDKNVRLAAGYAIDKKLIVDRLLRGYGVPIDTLQAPEYAAFDASITVPVRPGGSAKSCSRPRASRPTTR
jgi:peptide/nickel transport system substrate-binding protein